VHHRELGHGRRPAVCFLKSSCIVRREAFKRVGGGVDVVRVGQTVLLGGAGDELNGSLAPVETPPGRLCSPDAIDDA
jgi:hypothetical protein